MIQCVHVQHETVQYLYLYASDRGGKARHEAGLTFTKQLEEVCKLGDLVAAKECGLTCDLQRFSLGCAALASLHMH